MALLAHPLTEQSHVDHIDGDRANNLVTNLRWVTPSENQLAAHARMRLHGKPMGREKVDAAEVPAIRARHAGGESITALAKAFGLTRPGMYRLLFERKV